MSVSTYLYRYCVLMKEGEIRIEAQGEVTMECTAVWVAETCMVRKANSFGHMALTSALQC